MAMIEPMMNERMKKSI